MSERARGRESQQCEWRANLVPIVPERRIRPPECSQVGERVIVNRQQTITLLCSSSRALFAFAACQTKVNYERMVALLFASIDLNYIRGSRQVKHRCPVCATVPRSGPRVDRLTARMKKKMHGHTRAHIKNTTRTQFTISGTVPNCIPLVGGGRTEFGAHQWPVTSVESAVSLPVDNLLPVGESRRSEWPEHNRID